MERARIDARDRRSCRWLSLLVLAGFAGLALAMSRNPAQLVERVAADAVVLRAEATRWGLLAILGYIAAYALLMTMLWIPAWPCSVVGGLLFGIWLGSFCALCGATLGATTLYLLVRRGTKGIGAFRRAMVERFESGLSGDGFWFLVLVRLVPIFPFAAINVLASVLAVPLRGFVLSTALGIVPSTLVYVGLGNALEQGLVRPDFSRPDVLLVCAGLAGLGLLAIVGRRIASRK